MYSEMEAEESRCTLYQLIGNTRRFGVRRLFGKRYPIENRINHDDDDAASENDKECEMMMDTQNAATTTERKGGIVQS